MTAPTYRTFLFTPEPRRIRPGRWSWTVGDGYLRTLGDGVTVTRWGAYRARSRFAATCVEWTPQHDLDVIVEQLHAEGIDVEAHYDDRNLVCVRPLCACSTRDEVRVLTAFLRLTSAVRWEVTRA